MYRAGKRRAKRQPSWPGPKQVPARHHHVPGPARRILPQSSGRHTVNLPQGDCRRGTGSARRPAPGTGRTCRARTPPAPAARGPGLAAAAGPGRPPPACPRPAAAAFRGPSAPACLGGGLGGGPGAGAAALRAAFPAARPPRALGRAGPGRQARGPPPAVRCARAAGRAAAASSSLLSPHHPPQKHPGPPPRPPRPQERGLGNPGEWLWGRVAAPSAASPLPRHGLIPIVKAAPRRGRESGVPGSGLRDPFVLKLLHYLRVGREGPGIWGSGGGRGGGPRGERTLRESR